VNSRAKRILGAFVLGLVAIVSALSVGVSLILVRPLTVMTIFLAIKAGRLRIAWHDWLFIGLFVVTSVGAVGMFLRKRWARFPALLALGTYGAWAVVNAVLPDEWCESVFSFYVDRWFAIVAATLVLTAFLWLLSRQAKGELRRAGAVA